VRLVKTPDERLYALAGGKRREFQMKEIFDAAGFKDADVGPISAAELEAIPEDQPVSRWEF
jgi:hypothetical protein